MVDPGNLYSVHVIVNTYSPYSTIVNSRLLVRSPSTKIFAKWTTVVVPCFSFRGSPSPYTAHVSVACLCKHSQVVSDLSLISQLPACPALVHALQL
jgi:hypothetical protein